jgi:hypothetical protein
VYSKAVVARISFTVEEVGLRSIWAGSAQRRQSRFPQCKFFVRVGQLCRLGLRLNPSSFDQHARVKESFKENRYALSVIQLPFDSAHHSFKRAALNRYSDTRRQSLRTDLYKTVFLDAIPNFSDNFVVYWDRHPAGTHHPQNTACGQNRAKK